MKRKVVVGIIVVCLLMLPLFIQQDIATINATGETSTVTITLLKGWNLKGIPEVITASNLAAKSIYITAVTHRTITGVYETYIPTNRMIDFTCGINEGVYIYTNTDTTITFTITLTGYTRGDLWVDGNLSVQENVTFNNNLNVNGTMTVTGSFSSDDLTVAGDLTVDGELITQGDLTVGGNITVVGDMDVGANLQVDGNSNVTGDSTIGGYLSVEGNADFNQDLSVNGNITVHGEFNADNFSIGNITSENYIVGNLTILGNISGINQMVHVRKDLHVNGNLSVDGGITVGGNLSVTGHMEVTGNLTVTGDIIGATGRTADFVVVANDAPQWWKNQADYLCDGTDDDVQFQSANDALTAGGTICLSSGTFYINTQVGCSSNIYWVGQNDNTVIQAVETGGNTRLFFINGAPPKTNIGFSHMKFSGVGLTNYRDIIECWNGAYVTNLSFTHLTFDHAHNGLFIKQAQYILIDRINFFNTQQNVVSCNAFPISDVRISNIFIKDQVYGTAFILSSGRRIVIENVVAVNCDRRIFDISGIMERNDNAKDITINNVITYNCGGLLLAQYYLNPGVWAEDITVSNCIAYDCNDGPAIAGIFKNLTLDNIIINGVTKVWAHTIVLRGNHLYLNNIQCLNESGGEGIEIESNVDFPALIDIKLSNIYVENADWANDPETYGYGNGIKIVSNTTGGTSVQLTNVEVVGCNANGILIDNISYVQLTNVISRNNNWSGFNILNSTNVVMQGCIAINNSGETDDTFDNYNFYNVDDSIVTNCISNGSVIRNDFYFDDTCGEFVFTTNIVSNSTIDFPSSTVGWVIRDNIGFVTENWGYNASIGNGFTVTHGLAGTPTSIVITPAQNITVWITAKDATTFTVGLPTGSYDIYWYAIYRP